MVIGDETSQISFTVAEAVPAVEAALASLPNVEVLHCDSAGDANTSIECQRKAVDAGRAAVIASFGQIGSDVKVLTEAGHSGDRRVRSHGAELVLAQRRAGELCRARCGCR